MPRSRGGNSDAKVPVQFRIGEQLLERIDESCEQLDKSRNSWITEAVIQLIENESPVPLAVTAEQVLANKSTLMVRIDRLLVDLIDESCSDKGIPRTVWLLDACMSQLRNLKKESLRNMRSNCDQVQAAVG